MDWVMQVAGCWQTVASAASCGRLVGGANEMRTDRIRQCQHEREAFQTQGRDERLPLLSPPPPHLCSFCSSHHPSLLLTVSLLYIHAPTVNVNKAFSYTELMYPVHFTNVLPFKCHLLCCGCEYISAEGLFSSCSRLKLPSAAFAKFIYWQTSHDVAF